MTKYVVSMPSTGLLPFLQSGREFVLAFDGESVNALNGLTPISTCQEARRKMLLECVNALNGLTPISTL